MNVADLKGRWDIERFISDTLLNQNHGFSGHAEIDDGVYREFGEIILETGSRFVSNRQYVWNFYPDFVEICFEDGRPFHTLRPIDSVCQDNHFCDPDTYQVSYSFKDWPNWSTVWSVTGPRKRYQMTSVYRKHG